MKTISFCVEMGVNPRFGKNNSKQSVNIEELGAFLQETELIVEEETGIPITTVVYGPNRSCYKTQWDAPKGGELTYTIRGNSDPRIQLRKEPFPESDWKRAVLLLVHMVMIHYEQEYALIEFTDDSGVDSYVLSPEYGLEQAYREIP
ncbi:MAG: hypothetical protein K5886_06995 [Lachnospiraceae bacterium]|nr:hypothetical protein [Lachnospiraceae bacterium]